MVDHTPRNLEAVGLNDAGGSEFTLSLLFLSLSIALSGVSLLFVTILNKSDQGDRSKSLCLKI